MPVLLDSLLGFHKDLALLIAASKFPAEYRSACIERDEDPDSPDATPYAYEAALHIDPKSICDPKIRQEAIDAFGQDPFVIDSDKVYIDNHDNGVRVWDLTKYGSSFQYVIPKSNLLKLNMEDGCNSDDDEYVTIRIKTGKGGRGMYRVPKSVAGDMMGCD